MTERVDLEELKTSLDSALRTLGDYAIEFDAAVQGLSMPVGAEAASMSIAAGVLALIAELTELRAQAGGWLSFRDGSPAQQQPIWQWHRDYPTPAAVFYFGNYGSGWMWKPRYVEPAPNPPEATDG